jgi:hypothetical protein
VSLDGVFNRVGRLGGGNDFGRDAVMAPARMAAPPVTNCRRRKARPPGMIERLVM